MDRCARTSRPQVQSIKGNPDALERGHLLSNREFHLLPNSPSCFATNADKPTGFLPFILLATFLLITLALGWQPLDRTTWVMENLLVAVLLAALLASYRSFRLSRGATVALFVFLTLHEIGAHYSYAKVPYDAAWMRLTGRSLDQTLGFERNQFDRLVHFSYGLLLARPWREVVVAVTGLRAWRASYLALEFVLASSAAYELMEWIGGDYLHGVDIVGAQDDFWDAQKDMALATLGALLSLTTRRRKQGAAAGKTGSRVQ